MKKELLVFLLVFAITILFAVFTDHRWEDWYITFKASKNLAMGHGLVYTIGQRVYSFTSPIGTLLPAFLSYITHNANDDMVIWAYRFINAFMLGITAVFLLKLATRLALSAVSVLLIIVLFSTSILIIDFSINGMETAFMMYCIAAIIFLLYTTPRQLVFKLGLAIAGIMYTRPDGFIYAGSIMLGFFLFCPKEMKRKNIAIIYMKAIALAMVIYIPWLLWTWQYYGSPIPNTITAKALNHNYNAGFLMMKFITLPATIVVKGYSCDAVFMPPLYYLGGWHYLEMGSRVLSCIAVLSVFMPFVNRRARALGFALYLLHYYLIFISGQNAIPWYVPNLTIITIICLGLLLDQLYNYLKNRNKSLMPLKMLAALTVLYSLVVLLLGAWQIKQQQQIVEFNHRKQLGIWLKEHAASKNETVFLECLGYIGYYSGLKMYDHPGMSSPEVVNACRKINHKDFAFVINELKPDWLVLRQEETNAVNKSNPVLLRDKYIAAKTFDARENVHKAHLMFGEGFLMSDAYFDVYKKIKD